MTTGTQTLTDWLLACVAEDEAVARAVQEQFQPRVGDNLGPKRHELGRVRMGSARLSIHAWRVLAECEAKRHVIEMYQSFAEQAARNENPTLQLMDSARLALMDIILRALALPYADRPGFREDWL